MRAWELRLKRAPPADSERIIEGENVMENNEVKNDETTQETQATENLEVQTDVKAGLAKIPCDASAACACA